MKVFDIFESYNTTTNLDWQDHLASSKVATFKIGDEQYDIVINYYTTHLPARKSPFNVQEISFGRYVDGVRTVKLTPSASPAKVLSIVYNGVLDVIKIEKPEVVVFSAKILNDQQTASILMKRISLYQLTAQRVTQTGLYNYIGPVQSKHAYNFILLRSDLQLTPEELQWIRENI